MAGVGVWRLPGMGPPALVLLALCVAGARGLYFHIGETEKRCFIEEIPDETMVIGNYRTQMWDKQKEVFLPSTPGLGMHVEVKDPDGKVVLSRQYGSEGRFTFTSHTPGDHQICLHSNSTRMAFFAGGKLRVHLDIQVGEHANNYPEIAAKDKLTELQLRARQLLDQVEQIQKEQDYQRAEGQMSYVLVRSPNACTRQSQAAPKPGVRNSMQVSHGWAGTQLREPSPAAFQGAHWQEAGMGSRAGTRTRCSDTGRRNLQGVFKFCRTAKRGQLTSAGGHCPLALSPQRVGLWFQSFPRYLWNVNTPCHGALSVGRLAPAWSQTGAIPEGLGAGVEKSAKGEAPAAWEAPPARLTRVCCPAQYREERFRLTSESTNQRVLWWSIAQTVILILTGIWQMRHLKSFFEAKKLV